MTIQEAIKSGRRFRRAEYAWFSVTAGQIENGDAGLTVPLSLNDILATDWVVEPVKKGLSREDIEAAAEKLIDKGWEPSMLFVDELIRELGL